MARSDVDSSALNVVAAKNHRCRLARRSLGDDAWRRQIAEVGNVWGIGPTIAVSLVNQGFNTLAKLREAKEKGAMKFTRQQVRGRGARVRSERRQIERR